MFEEMGLFLWDNMMDLVYNLMWTLPVVLLMYIDFEMGELLDNMDRLNKENEFPIPDNDTGTNMVICFKRAVRALVQNSAKAGTDTSSDRPASSGQPWRGGTGDAGEDGRGLPRGLGGRRTRRRGGGTTRRRGRWSGRRRGVMAAAVTLTGHEGCRQ